MFNSFADFKLSVEKTDLFYVRMLRCTGHAARMGEKRGAYRVLVEKPEGRRPLGRPRRKLEGNIKMDLQEVGRGRGLDRCG